MTAELTEPAPETTRLRGSTWTITGSVTYEKIGVQMQTWRNSREIWRNEEQGPTIAITNGSVYGIETARLAIGEAQVLREMLDKAISRADQWAEERRQGLYFRREQNTPFVNFDAKAPEPLVAIDVSRAPRDLRPEWRGLQVLDETPIALSIGGFESLDVHLSLAEARTLHVIISEAIAQAVAFDALGDLPSRPIEEDPILEPRVEENDADSGFFAAIFRVRGERDANANTNTNTNTTKGDK